MIIVCCVCKKNQGEKEPFEDKTKTHGLCEACYKSKMKELENFDSETTSNRQRMIRNDGLLIAGLLTSWSKI